MYRCRPPRTHTTTRDQLRDCLCKKRRDTEELEDVDISIVERHHICGSASGGNDIIYRRADLC